MNSDEAFETLLSTAREAYRKQPEMQAFLNFPDDIVRQDVVAQHRPCADTFENEKRLKSLNHGALQEAIHAASPFAHWRETYKDTDIGSHFMDHFGCYTIIGDEGPYNSASIRLFMVFMPPDFYYPWHHHPAEEIYFVVAGNAVFMRENMEDMLLGEGTTTYHESNQSHALKTESDPVLCLVAWRNHFDIKPVLTPSL